MNIGISPVVAQNIAPKTSFKGVTAFAPTARPDAAETLNKIKNSKFGKTIIDKVGQIIKTITEKFSDGGLIKKAGVLVKKGINFATKTFKAIADNPVVKKISEAIGGIFKKAKPPVA